MLLNFRSRRRKANLNQEIVRRNQKPLQPPLPLTQNQSRVHPQILQPLAHLLLHLLLQLPLNQLSLMQLPLNQLLRRTLDFQSVPSLLGECALF